MNKKEAIQSLKDIIELIENCELPSLVYDSITMSIGHINEMKESFINAYYK